ncbi:putative non-LTR retroelement reverse transcriptase related protein, partial [Trifolium medium]|nr:putative non-LTR retroelement reverse transcriptase related protein [Trifolium medium]
MWCKVLKAKYGLRDGQVDNGGSRASSWWKYIISIKNGDDAYGGSWFADHIERKVGNGESTSFWKDAWLDGEYLKSHFGRLFDLCLNKDVSVADMRRLGWGLG